MNKQSPRGVQKKKKGKVPAIILVLLAATAVLLALSAVQKRARKQDASLVSPEEAARRYRPSVSYQGESYPLKRNTSSLLLIGTDNFVDDKKQHEGLPYNFNLADFLTVLVFDHRARTITPFQICRDTMCEVSLPSGETERMQITLSHSYGSGGADSCEITRKALEGLLFEVPIDSYLAFTMDTVPMVNDLLGGITIRLEEDLPALGPAYVKGATVTLRGAEALRFVRYRDTSLLDDNLRRMGHHRQYLTAVVEAARKASADDDELPLRIFRAVEKFVNTDLSAENLSTLFNNLNEYTVLPAVTADGTYAPGEDFPEYLIDEASLWSCVRSVFCA
jgi:LCP family protein required for cell wall assembly